MTDSVYIASTGMVCPVGLNAEASCAAMQAGIAGFEELSFQVVAGESIIGSVVPNLAPEIPDDGRQIELLQQAVAECLADAGLEETKNIPILVGLAQAERPGSNRALVDKIIPALERRLGLSFHGVYSCAIPSGHTSGFEALREARELLKKQGIEVCLVCGVDSYINVESLAWLNGHWRLKTESNSDGVIPGEAAAAITLRANPIEGSAAMLHVRGLGFGIEGAAIMTEEPLLGLGLTEATSAALTEAGVQMHETDFRIVDASGESYSFKEQALVFSKLYRGGREVSPALWHCAENIGETGAAAGIIQLIVASCAFEKGYAPGKIAMCSTSADLGGRAVAIVSRNSSPPPNQ